MHSADSEPEAASLILPQNDDVGGTYGSIDSNNTHSKVNESIGKSMRRLRESIAPFNASVRGMEGTSSMGVEMFNLTKNLVGAGALGLPSGIAALAGASRSGWQMVPAALIIAVMGVVFAYYFVLVGRLCIMLDASSYGGAWHNSAGRRVGLWANISCLVPLSIIGITGVGSLSYSMIIADTTRSLVERAGIHVERNTCLYLVTIFILLPLCMVKKLSVLAPFSAVGTGGIIFTMLVMAKRCFDGSYDAKRGGKFLSSTPSELQPVFHSDDPVVPAVSDTFLLLCMCFQAFFCHYNAPRFYMELENATIERFNCVANVAFVVSAVIYFGIGALGYYTFGEQCDGFILNNYSANDDLASICRLAIAIAFACTYPLPFIGIRDGILDLFEVDDASQTSTNLNVLSLAILSVITAFACHFTDLALVNAVGGGALGTAVVFIFPSISFYFAVSNMKDAASFWLKCESVLCLVLMLLGVALGAIGVTSVVSGI